MLNSAMTRINENTYMPLIMPFVKKLTHYITDELYFCNGVFILEFMQLPFSAVPSAGYLSVKETARLYVESYACLSKTKRDTSKYKQTIESKMNSGYANEYSDTPTFCSRIIVREGIQKGVPITLLSSHILTIYNLSAYNFMKRCSYQKSQGRLSCEQLFETRTST